METNTGSGLRKGSWTQEEDNLLRACIHQYGEGKWHLVPQRAGLKRCRKSCRMRWLNYLKPNIKRGSFTDDEVDMMRRFHKLLGNRWSLIAGRLQGRTANDVKNFWHTNMRNKTEENQRKKKAKDQVMNNNIEETTAEVVVKQHVVIKPQPHTFSKNSPWLRRNKLVSASDAGDETNNNMNASAAKTSSAEPCGGRDFKQRDHHHQSKEWWESLLNKEVDEGQVGNFTMMEFWDDEEDFLKMEGPFLEGQSSWSPCSYKF